MPSPTTATARAGQLAEPQIAPAAQVHALANIIGDVRIAAGVHIAAGVSIRADEGAPFQIGEDSLLQEGAVIHGLVQGRVLGDDQSDYSVWLGRHVAITHKALIHGPAYLGDDCFVGFRSTVFNARVGAGSVIMMHALVQDVEIPPGRYVPSGAIITTQQQADRLPEVRPEDREFARHIIGSPPVITRSAPAATAPSYSTPTPSSLHPSSSEATTVSAYNSQGRLSSDVVNQVRSLLAQGYRIGTEHADKRRFRTSSWQSCAPIQTSNERQVLAELENCLAEHEGEYVRLLGIDTANRSRVFEALIQDPHGPVGNKQAAAPVAAGVAPTASASHASNGSGSGDVASQVRGLLSQGYRISAEVADKRRFQTGSWQSLPTISGQSESTVLSAVNALLQEYQGKYVRLIGIDPAARRRVAEFLIQKP